MKSWRVLLLTAPILLAQEPPAWQVAAGGKMAFEVASIKVGPSDAFVPPPFPLDSGDAYAPTGGRFVATFPLAVYIQFAYKLHLTREQMEPVLAHLPKWVENDRFAIEARAAISDPTKDQMRLMMQSLLADRFKLAVHFETPTVPVFAMTLMKAGKTGPGLRPHAEGPLCDKAAPMPVLSGAGLPDPAAVFPPACDVYMVLKGPKGIRVGSRNTTMELIAETLSGFSELGRPVVDQTGLSGRYDFRIEWMPELNRTPSPDVDSQAPSLREAVREELGVKLEPTKAPIRVLIVDHVERPTEN
ncbi:MAG TPA: TIGR03435 family protein [Bryobacteraceae bacterium]|nr:TIGR03435 family protein [Bryobacteraceae bacterium]